MAQSWLRNPMKCEGKDLKGEEASWLSYERTDWISDAKEQIRQAVA